MPTTPKGSPAVSIDLNVTTNEGGSIYDEVFARNVIDRTDAFGTIFLGLTTGCAVCHDHKFDPISMRDYYSLFAFFNSLDGRAMDANVKDPAPVIPVPSEEQQQMLAEYDQSFGNFSRRCVGRSNRSTRPSGLGNRSLADGTRPQGARAGADRGPVRSGGQDDGFATTARSN